MEAWSVHQLHRQAEVELGSDRALELQRYAQRLRCQGLPVIFSLKHLSKITGVDYRILHDTVGRKREAANYRMFSVQKRSGRGRRYIHAVTKHIFTAQHFINGEILQRIPVHPSAFAFRRNGGVGRCAAMHCGARWLFQFDLSDFFYGIAEVDVFHVFEQLGYGPLLAFELARICTTTHLPQSLQRSPTMHRFSLWRYPPYGSLYVDGVLPQGAPTSPMLSNLVARRLDERLFSFALSNGFVYTRYADDIAFSARELPRGVSVATIHQRVVHIIRSCRFAENEKKTRISGPGSRKTILGLLVDSDQPRISKQMYARIDRYLYGAGKFGIEKAAMHEQFDSAYGFYNHLVGLLSFVRDVDKARGYEFQTRLGAIPVPWI